MRGEIDAIFKRAASGQLYSPQQSATAKLRALQVALRTALTAGGVPRAVVARWQLYNSNLFPGCPTEGIEESPVSITLNCAPPPDDCCCEEAPRWAARPSATPSADAAVPPAWTPDYLSAIRDALIAEGVWPGAVTPLCLECACHAPHTPHIRHASAHLTIAISTMANLLGTGASAPRSLQAKTSWDQAHRTPLTPLL